MYLEKIIISNYKSCQFLDLNLTENTPNIFIGLNDSGKSTILQALLLLLSDKPEYNYINEGNNKSDLSNSILELADLNYCLNLENLPSLNLEGNSTTIIGKFIYDEEENENFSNLNLSNPLMWSIESNENKIVWLVRNFHKSTINTFVLAKENVESPLELWNAKQTDINKLIKDFNISNEEIGNENGTGRFTNLEKFRSIYAQTKCTNIWTDYKFAKSDKDIFPEFSLFDWNVSLDEIISTAKSIMKDEIDEYLEPLKKEAIEKASLAEKAINEKFGELSKTINQVAKEVESISSKVHFDVKENISDVMVTKSYSDGPIHLENQGEGLKRQIWFSLIKAKANLREDNYNKFIWAFDEPETHLYPGAHREFFDNLNTISKGDVQTLISTHSTIFTDKSKIDSINSVQKNEGYTELNFCHSIDSIFSTLNIKNSDFLFFDKFLIVEGDTEQYLIPELYKIYTGRTLLEDNIQLINIRGKDNWTINKSVLENVLKDFKKEENTVIYLFDNDMRYLIGSNYNTNNTVFVGKQDIEDSISPEVWVNILNQFYEYEVVEKTFIEDILSSIPNGPKCQKNNKFFKKLKSSLRKKWENEGKNVDHIKHLPDKGRESAEFILKGITDKSKIPFEILEAFDKLRE